MKNYKKPANADGESLIDFDERGLFGEDKEIWNEKGRNGKHKNGYLVFYLYIPGKNKKAN